MKQIITIISNIEDIDISDLRFEIDCYIKGHPTHTFNYDFPLACSILASYLQRPLPSQSIFVGDVDLGGNIRGSKEHLHALASILYKEKDRINKVFVSSEDSNSLRELLTQKFEGPINTEIIGVPNLKEFIQKFMI